MVTLDKCPICGSSRIDPVNTPGLGPMVRSDLWGFTEVKLVVYTTYYACVECGIVFQNPRPEQQAMTEWYASGTYRQSLNLTTEQIDNDELHRAKRIGEMLKSLGEYGSHLDVGCSRGFLLQEVGAREKHGVELNPSWVGDNNIQVTDDVFAYDPETFDLATIIHTLEHDYDPVGTLKKVYVVMKRGALLYVEVPGNHKDGLRLPHLYYFVAPSLQAIAAEAGLVKVEVKHVTPNLGVLFRKE